MNGLLYQAERPSRPSDCRPVGPLHARSTDHRVNACQVILSLSTSPVLLLKGKDPERGFPNEVPSGPVWVDRSGIASGRAVKRAPLSARIESFTLIRPFTTQSGARNFPYWHVNSTPALSEKALRSRDSMRRRPASEISFASEAVVCNFPSPDNRMNGALRVPVGTFSRRQSGETAPAGSIG